MFHQLGFLVVYIYLVSLTSSCKVPKSPDDDKYYGHRHYLRITLHLGSPEYKSNLIGDVAEQYYSMVYIGGGTKDNPKDTGFIMGPDAKFCAEPRNNKKSIRLGHEVYRPGIAMVDGGFVVCGGIIFNGDDSGTGRSNACHFWNKETMTYSKNVSKIPDSQFGDLTGAAMIANNYGRAGIRNNLFLVAEHFPRHVGSTIFHGVFNRYGINGISWSPGKILPMKFNDIGCFGTFGTLLYVFGRQVNEEGKLVWKVFTSDIKGKPKMVFEQTMLPLAMRDKFDQITSCSFDFLMTGQDTQNAFLFLFGRRTIKKNKQTDSIGVVDISNGVWLNQFEYDTQTNFNYSKMAILSHSRSHVQYIVGCEQANGDCDDPDVFRLFMDDPCKKMNYTHFRFARKNARIRKRNAGKTMRGSGMVVVPSHYFPWCPYTRMDFSKGSAIHPSLYLITTVVLCITKFTENMLI